jgi:hypothetical protein
MNSLSTRRLLADQETYPVRGFRAELLFSMLLLLIVGGYSTYLVLG